MEYTNQTSYPVSNSSNKMKWVLIILTIVVVIAAAAWFLMGGKNGRILGASTTTDYQAVFLTNGQVYFGKFAEKGDWIELTDIYYLQVTQNLQAAASGDSQTSTTPGTTDKNQNIQLVKLGSELHGPQDAMHIMKDKVLFWENMKDDSKVVQAIKQYKNK